MEKYLKKGHEVIIKGRISNRSYEDKSGVTKYISEIIVSEIVKLTKDA
jgi:single-strand DNA-binding protein